VHRNASGEQQRNQPAGLPYALLQCIECSRKNRWSVRHLPVMGARQTRHGLQPAFGLTSNSSAEFCLATAGVVMLSERGPNEQAGWGQDGGERVLPLLELK
jgi:hypothetical protein